MESSMETLELRTGAETWVQPNGRHRDAPRVTPAQKRKKRQLRKRFTWGIIGLLALGIIALVVKIHGQKSGGALAGVQTAQVTRTTLVETVSAQGSVTPQTGAEVKIGSQITGRIKRLYADVGSHVDAGQVIADLDLPDTQAQLGSAQAALAQAVTKYQQQQSGVGMQNTQSSDAVTTAEAGLRAAQAKLASSQAAAEQQPRQTQADIQRAQAALNSARAAETQANESHNQEISQAQAAVRQAQATSQNAASNLKREQQLFRQGFIAAVDVDTADTQAKVASAQLQSAQQNLSLATSKANADVQTAQQQVAQAQASLQAAEAETFQNAVTQANVQDSSAAVRQAEAQLQSAQAGLAQNVLKGQDVTQAAEAVQQAQQQVTYWQAQVDKGVIRSPISGTVLQLAAQQGETLAAGLSAPTLIVVADLNRLQVDAYVDETDIGNVNLGQSASVTVDTYPNATFTGTVTKIASGSTLQQNVVTYDVTVAIQDPKHLLKPDMTTSVTITVGNHPNVLAVPNEAVKTGKSGSIVWVVRKGQPTPQMQAVTTGATDGTDTEIRSGLQGGETVVTAGWPPPGGSGGGMKMTPFGIRAGHGGGHGG